VHKEFQKAIEASVCRYVPEKGILSVMVIYLKFGYVLLMRLTNLAFFSLSHGMNQAANALVCYKICISGIFPKK